MQFAIITPVISSFFISAYPVLFSLSDVVNVARHKIMNGFTFIPLFLAPPLPFDLPIVANVDRRWLTIWSSVTATKSSVFAPSIFRTSAIPSRSRDNFLFLFCCINQANHSDREQNETKDEFHGLSHVVSFNLNIKKSFTQQSTTATLYLI
jgi:hypothetical protein